MDLIPDANFPDPLLKSRSAQRWQLFKTYATKPFTIIAILLGALPAIFVHPALFPGVTVVILAIALGFADQKARADWWVQVLKKFGFTVQPEVDALPLTPLLRSGDEREVLRRGSDGRRELVVFRSTDVSYDKNGRHETNHDYTLVVYPPAPPAIAFLSAHPHNWGAVKFLGDGLRGATPRGVDEFEIESVDLHKKWELRCSTVDGTRAREIFEPTFIVWFAHSGLLFEYENGVLIVGSPGKIEHSSELELLLSRADQIQQRIQAEA